MPEEKKGFVSKTNETIRLVTGIFFILGVFASFVLIYDQVKRNKKAIEEADLKVMNYRLKQIEKTVDKIYNLVLEDE